jgi:hypothetical protein
MRPHRKQVDPGHRDDACRALLLAPYTVGDYVVPTDLPRQFVCRVTESHPVDGTTLQVLELRPFDGPWPQGTRLVRGSDWVRPAVAAEVGALRRRRARLTRARRRRCAVGQPAPIRLLPNRTQSSSRTPTGTPIR